MGRLRCTVGSETRKTRAAAVVSTDAANRALDRVQVLPITSKVAKVYPAQVLVTREKTSAQGYGRSHRAGLQASSAQAHGRLDPIGLTAVDRAIRIQPALWLTPA